MRSKTKPYWDLYAEAFARKITADSLMGKLVTNPNVTGAYAEALIRKIVEDSLPGLRVSTGAIVLPADLNREDKREVPQCDLIIWDPAELPAIFEDAGFALVPSVSVLAVIEVKRSLTAIDARQQMKKIQKRMPKRVRDYVLGVVIKHPTSLHAMPVTSRWVTELLPKKPEAQRPVLARILDSKSNAVDTDGLFLFLYFLSQVAKLARA